MVSLRQYIFENARTTNSNTDRKKELESWLKNKNYTDYVATLNDMLKDPKAKTLLQDGFGGELGNMQLTYSVKHISASALRPTQAEIDISKSVKHALTKPDNIKRDFGKQVIINSMPLITFRGNYIIDGHHRWAEEVIINPDGKMVCFDYDGNISPIQMLKAVQGAIAAVLASKDNMEIPSGKVKDRNIFDLDNSALRAYIDANISDEVINELMRNVKSISDKTSCIDYLIDNISSMKANNYPELNSPNRGEMPQTDKAGSDITDKKTSYPDSKGSALNKLKTGKIDKDVLK